MEVAEAQCVQYALDGGSSVTVGMAAGTGGGWGNNGWGGWGPGWGYGGGSGVGVGVSAVTELPDGRSPAQIYAACVQRRSGLPPVTPFNQRPEIKG